MLELPGSQASSKFRLSGLLARLRALNPSVRSVEAQYRYFVVDVYQDVNPLQQRLLDAWLGGRAEVCVVGDPNQTIYSFTGADPDHLLGRCLGECLSRAVPPSAWSGSSPCPTARSPTDWWSVQTPK